VAKSGRAAGRGVSVTVIVVTSGPVLKEVVPKTINIPCTPVLASVSPVPLSTEKLKCAVHVFPGAVDPPQVPSDIFDKKLPGFMASLASPVTSEVKPPLKVLKVIAPVVLFVRV
jgi:hypothetical protein